MSPWNSCGEKVRSMIESDLWMERLRNWQTRADRIKTPDQVCSNIWDATHLPNFKVSIHNPIWPWINNNGAKAELNNESIPAKSGIHQCISKGVHKKTSVNINKFWSINNEKSHLKFFSILRLLNWVVNHSIFFFTNIIIIRRGSYLHLRYKQI